MIRNSIKIKETIVYKYLLGINQISDYYINVSDIAQAVLYNPVRD